MLGMKKKLFICGVSALLIGIVSCKSQRKDTKVSESEMEVATADNTENAVDWDGLYTGILPCADCEGIQTSLELSLDNTYKLKRVYLDKYENRFDTSGKFTWDKNGSIITLEGEGEESIRYLVGENFLFMLDQAGNMITGELADYCVLAKIDTGLVEKYWKLTELFGEPVSTPKEGKEAHIIFRKEGNRMNGNSGCNDFNGTYRLNPGDRIGFSQTVSTLMMCSDMETETRLNRVFQMADKYVVNGNSLTLNNAGMDTLACFEAVHIP
jgi:heat shock protein HslJ